MSRLSIGIVISLAFSVGCNSAHKASGPEYVASVRAWQKHREDGLRKPDSWLTLVGLFWLKPGVNTIGSADSNDFILPKGSAPAHSGAFQLEGDKVTFLHPDKKVSAVAYAEEHPT